VSPSALSAYRRLGLTGDLVGTHLGRATVALLPPGKPVDEDLEGVTGGKLHRAADLEANEAVVSLRTIPLDPGGSRVGALVLTRDVTDLRSRDRQLMTKDATIREIHHRVKNNLQTVAALLRLQSRRVGEPGAREALDEAVRRVGSIAIVHETLSLAVDEQVDFDAIADRIMLMVAEVSGAANQVVATRDGSFGSLPAEIATPLAMVLTELLQNAHEHGLGRGPGLIEVSATRAVGRLAVTVIDDGRGLPEGFDPDISGNLGLQIVRTLVVGELNGQLEMQTRQVGGTKIALDIPLT